MYVRLRFTETRVYADDHPGASARAGFFFDLVLSIFVFFPLFYTKIVHCRTSCIPARGDKKMSAHVPHIMRVILLYSRTLHVYIRLSRVLCLIYICIEYVIRFVRTKLTLVTFFHSFTPLSNRPTFSL